MLPIFFYSSNKNCISLWLKRGNTRTVVLIKRIHNHTKNILRISFGCIFLEHFVTFITWATLTTWWYFQINQDGNLRDGYWAKCPITSLWFLPWKKKCRLPRFRHWLKFGIFAMSGSTSCSCNPSHSNVNVPTPYIMCEMSLFSHCGVNGYRKHIVGKLFKLLWFVGGVVTYLERTASSLWPNGAINWHRSVTYLTCLRGSAQNIYL